MPRRQLLALSAACLVLAAGTAACFVDRQPTPSPSPPAGASSPSSAPSAGGTSPSLPSDEPSPQPTVAETIGQTDTDTEIGRIWDVLPEGFPEYPGSTPTETGDGPVSAQFSVPADVSTVTPYLQAAMETAGFSTESLSAPLEDGSVVLTSVGPESIECRVQTTIAPAGGTTIVTVLYGSVCPID